MHNCQKILTFEYMRPRGYANKAYRRVSRRSKNENRSASAKMDANRPVWIAPRIRRLTIVSVLRKPVSERLKAYDKTTRTTISRREPVGK